MLQISRHLDSSKDATGARTGVVKLSIMYTGFIVFCFYCDLFVILSLFIVCVYISIVCVFVLLGSTYAGLAFCVTHVFD